MAFMTVRKGGSWQAMGAWLGLALLLAACARPAPLLRPNGVAIGADGSLYVMDRGNYRVAHLAPDGRLLGAFGKLGTRAADIHSGWDIALDSQGHITICNLTFSEEADLIYDGLKVFAPDGALIREIGHQDYAYDDGLTSHRPYGLDIDAQDRVYVADFAVNSLRVFDAQGQLLGTWGGQTGSGEGEFNGLNDVVVDDRRNLVYLADSINCRIQQFERVAASEALTLTYRLSFGSYGDEPGQLAYPQYLAVDEASGTLYVADLANQRVQAFDPQGRYLSSLAPTGVDTWQVMGLTVGPDGYLYAADALNNAIWAFRPDGQVHRRIEVKR